MRALPGVDEVEIVSLAGDVKEAVLWCRGLATPGVRRRATLLPTGATLTDADAPDACPVAPPGRFLYEPDGAVVRAGSGAAPWRRGWACGRLTRRSPT